MTTISANILEMKSKDNTTGLNNTNDTIRNQADNKHKTMQLNNSSD